MPLLEQVLEKYPGKVRLAYKSFPIKSHKLAKLAAQAALAAGQQKKFWQYHDRLYENYNKLTPELLEQFARDMGLDMDRFQKDRNSRELLSLINRDIQEGVRIGVRGTPTIFINGKRLEQRSLEGFSAVIDNALNVRK